MSASRSVEVYPAHTSIRRPPIHLPAEDVALFRREFAHPIRATTVESIADAIIVSGDAVLGRRDWRFRTEATHTHGLTRRQKLRKAMDLFKPAQHFDTGIWATDNWSMGYFHWLTDALPRILAARTITTDHPVLLPATFASIPFVGASLEVLGIPVQYFDPGKRVHVRELVMPSHTASTGNYNKQLVTAIRTGMAPDTGGPPRRSIYISRSRSARRRVINEDTLLPLLSSHGVEVHHFEDYDLGRQIDLMRDCAVLIGLHGAGLTNMLFMPTGGHVIEIRNRNDASNNCYFALASDMEHGYDYLLANGNTDDTHLVDVMVDPVRIEEVLERIPR